MTVLFMLQYPNEMPMIILYMISNSSVLLNDLFYSLHRNLTVVKCYYCLFSSKQSKVQNLQQLRKS